jgi:hypothetical protein
VLRSAAICNLMILNFSIVLAGPIYRSKFNVPLGVEAQGFCVIR